jgi:hypothetical protein
MVKGVIVIFAGYAQLPTAESGLPPGDAEAGSVRVSSAGAERG